MSFVFWQPKMLCFSFRLFLYTDAKLTFSFCKASVKTNFNASRCSIFVNNLHLIIIIRRRCNADMANCDNAGIAKQKP